MVYLQTNPNETQMLLNNSERFGLLLAENLSDKEMTNLTVDSENISM